MTLVAAWVGVPLVLGALSLGCALLLTHLSRARVSSALLLPLGLAVVIVVSQALTAVGPAARLATPAVVAIAIVGLVMGRQSIRPALGPWLIAALVVYLAYLAPVLASGDVTFAGYRRLDDTAGWLAIIDRVMTHGRGIAGLSPSSYQATLAAYLPGGYPLGSFLSLGVVQQLLRTDPMWLYQPFLAYAAALLALSLYELSRRFGVKPPLAVLVASIAAQPATLYAYAMWGGIKEMVAAAMLPLIPALAADRRGMPVDWRGVLPLAVACSALLATLSAGAIVWIVPLVLPALIAGVSASRRAPWRALRLRELGWLVLVVAICSAPVIALAPTFLKPLFGGGDVPGGVFTNADQLGILAHRLDLRQLVGIWPSDDFRFGATHVALADALIVAAIALAVAGVVVAWRRGRYALPAYVLGAVAVSLAIRAHSSPWVDAKSLAQSSPAILLAALCFAAIPFERRALRGLGVAAIGVLGAGVLWSNALTYAGMNLAPHDQLSELVHIAGIATEHGPTLFADGGSIGPAHILRDADAVSVSGGLTPPLARGDGTPLPPAMQVDIDQLDQTAVWAYKSLVLRRSPDASRPLAPYRLRWSGRYFELWERPADAAIPRGHLPLGDKSQVQPGAQPDCATIMRIARDAGPTGRLATVARGTPTVIGLGNGKLPHGWFVESQIGDVIPNGNGTIERTFTLAEGGRMQVWVAGSTRAQTTILIDGRRVASVRHELNASGRFMPFGEVLQLDRGRHRLTLQYGDNGLHPGHRQQHVRQPYLGPVVLSEETAARPVAIVPAARARALCRERLDWVELLSPGD